MVRIAILTTGKNTTNFPSGGEILEKWSMEEL